MSVARVRKVGALLALAVLLFTFIAFPAGDGSVFADGVSGGHPITPPPPDSTEDSIQPDPQDEVWTESVLLLNGLSMMLI